MDDFRESTRLSVIMKAGELAGGETQVEKFVVQQWSSLNRKWMDGPSEMYDTEGEARERQVEISGWDHIDRTRIVHRTVAVAERVLGDAPPGAGGGRAAVLTWDYREQPDLDRLAARLRELSGGSIHLHRVHTGSDQYAIVLATTPLDEATVQDTFNRWWLDDDASDIIKLA